MDKIIVIMTKEELALLLHLISSVVPNISDEKPIVDLYNKLWNLVTKS